MGHVGLTPQTATMLGGYRAQGRTAARARQVLDDALALQEAGCFAIVFEAIPAEVTDVIMPHMEIPVIGIGAGPSTDGQVLVLHDLLGDPRRLPAEVRQALRGASRQEMLRGVEAYAEEVRTRRVPGAGAHVRHRARRSSSGCRADADAPRSATPAITSRSHTLAARWPAVAALRAQGARVLRPLRGGGRQLRARRRAARAACSSSGPITASWRATSSSASRRATASRTTSSSG